ncbi:MAG: cytochrome b5 domain-containing protein [Marinobacter sp.]|nr:cytochrome b5 domain-containing protein [Marinobacter sp.]
MMTNRIAYTALVAFVTLILTLSISAWLSSKAEVQTAANDTTITLQELAQHNSAESCWKAIDGKVYDITRYIPDHPTEPAVVLAWCGKESSQPWHNKTPGRPHSPRALAMLDTMLIGTLAEQTAVSQQPQQQAPVAADARLKRPDGEILLGLAPGTYLDGRYRGTFADRGYIQVGIQFELRQQRIRNLTYRSLDYAGVNYLRLSEEDDLYPVLLQHQRIAEDIEGQPLSAIFRLYEPADSVPDIDGYTGATLRGAKIISAFRDGLNRGVYQW